MQYLNQFTYHLIEHIFHTQENMLSYHFIESFFHT